MGHLFSRAFKRLTQCSSQSRNQPQQSHQREKPVEQQGHQHDQSSRPSVQAIPVGQSIDSAEYADLQAPPISTNNHESSESHQSRQQQQQTQQQQQQQQTSQEINHPQPQQAGENVDGDDHTKEPDVEGAVIKIQALVRGHLTRKALKDAHQHSAPPLNALGQSQFDEESLTKNPPNAVFLPTSPLISTLQNSPSQQATSINKAVNDQSTVRTPLESIEELLETSASFTQPQQSPSIESQTIPNRSELKPVKETSDEGERKKLSALYLRSASSPSKLGNQLGGSISPVPSEANVSIDLDCGTPASASIDIQDHNLKPTDRIASVLHPGQPGELSPPTIRQLPIAEEPGEQKDQVVVISKQDRNNVGTPDSIDSEEAAAIRIQSAFRGYRTRKNSPYRTRSPTSSPGCLKRNALKQQEAAVLLEEENGDFNGVEADLAGTDEEVVSRTEERRSSRARQREGGHSSQVSTEGQEESKQEADECDVQSTTNRLVNDGLQRIDGGVIGSTTSMDEFTTTDTTIKEITGRGIRAVPNQQQVEVAEQSVSISLNATRAPTIQLGSTTGGKLPATPSSSLETGELRDSAVHDHNERQNLSAALEASQADQSVVDYGDELGLQTNQPSSALARPSIGSAETDSSVLGAALSEDMSEEVAPPLSQVLSSSPATISVFTKRTDEDKLPGDVSMTTDELEAEARRLVDEMTGESQPSIEATFNQTGAALEDPTTADESFAINDSVLLNEEEQRAIELESDDIELRDPRGHVSEERAKSPQIKPEAPSFELSTGGGQVVESEVESLQVSGGNSNLNVEQPVDLAGSGRSSPAFNSSGCGSSSSRSPSPSSSPERDDRGSSSKQNEANQKRQQQQQQQTGNSSQLTGRNKKRNRNKKKGKK